MKTNQRFFRRLKVGFCLCFAFVCSSGCASDKSVAPILFRDYPWGISLTEVADDFIQETAEYYNQLYPDKEINIESFEAVISPYGDGFYPFAAECFCGEHSVDYVFEISGMSSVAGYADVFTTVYAYADVSEDGTVSESMDDSHLFHGQYRFVTGRKADDGAGVEDKAIYDDLLIKLTTLYGEGTKKENEAGVFETTEIVWFGANNTAVALNKDYLYVTIDYWDVNSCDMIQKISGAEDAIFLNADGL